jgi:hypothetical protein
MRIWIRVEHTKVLCKLPDLVEKVSRKVHKVIALHLTLFENGKFRSHVDTKATSSSSFQSHGYIAVLTRTCVAHYANGQHNSIIYHAVRNTTALEYERRNAS